MKDSDKDAVLVGTGEFRVDRKRAVEALKWDISKLNSMENESFSTAGDYWEKVDGILAKYRKSYDLGKGRRAYDTFPSRLEPSTARKMRDIGLLEFLTLSGREGYDLNPQGYDGETWFSISEDVKEHYHDLKGLSLFYSLISAPFIIPRFCAFAKRSLSNFIKGKAYVQELDMNGLVPC